MDNLPKGVPVKLITPIHDSIISSRFSFCPEIKKLRPVLPD